jgi:hypothetical protein
MERYERDRKTHRTVEEMAARNVKKRKYFPMDINCFHHCFVGYITYGPWMA